MATQIPQFAAFDMPNMIDMKAYDDAFKTAASMNERLASIAIQAGTRATTVSTETANETFANLRDLTQMREDPAAYAQAFMDFAQKQNALLMHATQTFATDMQKTGGAASDLASKAGEEMAAKAPVAPGNTARKPAPKAA